MGRQIRFGMVAALAAAIAVMGCSRWQDQPAKFDPEYTVYAALLQRHVDDQGLVDYPGLKADSVLLRQACENLKLLPADSMANWPAGPRLAFWINAYNLLALRIVIDAYPIDSITAIKDVWTKPGFAAAGRFVTLNDIEQNILRREFMEPHFYFTLAPASKGGPALRREPYRAASIRGQLLDAARRFLSDSARNNFDTAERYAYLSPIFQSAGRDFEKIYASEIPGDQPEEVRAVFNFIAEVLPDSVGRFLRGEGIRWAYSPYDWSLNDQGTAQPN